MAGLNRVKGRDFSIKSLLNNDESLASLFGANPSLAIFRLAPQVQKAYLPERYSNEMSVAN